MVNYSNFSIDYKKSKGRLFQETEDINRTCFMRDRDRIIHSSAFRRLKYKTQVFVQWETGRTDRSIPLKIEVHTEGYLARNETSFLQRFPKRMNCCESGGCIEVWQTQ